MYVLDKKERETDRRIDRPTAGSPSQNSMLRQEYMLKKKKLHFKLPLFLDTFNGNLDNVSIINVLAHFV